jgi:hypothetical protein
VALDKLDSRVLFDYLDGKTELPSYVKLPLVAGAASTQAVSLHPLLSCSVSVGYD